MYSTYSAHHRPHGWHRTRSLPPEGILIEMLSLGRDGELGLRVFRCVEPTPDDVAGCVAPVMWEASGNADGALDCYRHTVHFGAPGRPVQPLDGL